MMQSEAWEYFDLLLVLQVYQKKKKNEYSFSPFIKEKSNIAQSILYPLQKNGLKS